MVEGGPGCAAEAAAHRAAGLATPVDEHRAVVGESTVRRYVAEARRRQPAVLAKVSVPQTHPPGADSMKPLGCMRHSRIRVEWCAVKGFFASGEVGAGRRTGASEVDVDNVADGCRGSAVFK